MGLRNFVRRNLASNFGQLHFCYKDSRMITAIIEYLSTCLNNLCCNRLLCILVNRVICQPTIGGPSTLRFSSRADLKNVISDAQKLDNSHNRARQPHVSCLGYSHTFQFESSTLGLHGSSLHERSPTNIMLHKQQ